MASTSRGTLNRSAFLIAAVCGTIISNSSIALAQAPAPTVKESPAIKRDAGRIDAYAKVLKLDEAQTQTARELYEAMNKDRERASRRMRDAIQESQEDRGAGEHAAAEERLGKALREQREASRTLTTRFLDDLKALLRADQQDNWTKLEQFRRRELYLRGGFLGGSSVDLTKVVGDLKLTGEVQQQAGDILAQYEPDLDKALQERERNAMDDDKAFNGMQRFNEKSLAAHQEKTRAADMRVREVNLKYLKQLTSILPEETAKKLEDQYQLKAYRSAYRTTVTGKNITDAAKLDNLTPEQKARLERLAARYAKDARAAGDRMAAAQRKAEDAGGGGSDMIMFGGPGIMGNVQDPDLAAARKDRSTVDADARKELEGILSPDQIAELPKPQGTGGRRVQVFSGGGAGDEMVFVSDVDEEDLPPSEGGTVVFRTVEVVAPAPPHGGQGQQTSPKPD